jgi:mono/diheme cytochrome c family protein
MKCARHGLVISLLLLGTSLSLAQNNATAGKPKGDSYGELAQAPEKARVRVNPLEHDPEAPLAGRKLYGRHCAECHGANAEGGKKAPSLRAPEVQQATPGTLFWVLTNGVVRHGMPVWSKLPEPQRWQIVSFLKSLGEAAPLAAPENSGSASSARQH